MPKDTLLETNGSRKAGYKRALERYTELGPHVRHFETWLQSVEQWLHWIDKNIEDNTHASKREVLEDFHLTPLGLEILERLGIDIYPENRDNSRTEYDIKKLLRAIVCLPTIARLQGKRLDRKHQNINTVFKEIIDDTLSGKTDIDSISSWEPPPAE